MHKEIKVSLDSLFSQSQRIQLLQNNKLAKAIKVFEPNFVPVSMLKASQLNYTFLVYQLSYANQAHAFVLCDYSNSNLQLKVVDLEEVEKDVQKKGDMLIANENFRGSYTLLTYAKVADSIGKIIIDESSEKEKKLFDKYSKDERYNSPNTSIRRFKFDLIW